jgi:hypothetical protein
MFFKFIGMKINKWFIFLLFTNVFLLSGCTKENSCDCIKRTGEIVKVKRALSDFDKIIVEDNLTVFIKEDSLFDVTVEAGKNIEPLIETEVKNGVLFLRNKNRCNWARSYKKPLNVYITMPTVRYITSDGTADIQGLDTIRTEIVDVMIRNSGNVELTFSNKRVLSHMHGSGDVTLHGYTDEHDVSIGGTAYLYAGDLETNYTYINTFTLGSSYIRAKDLLIIKIEEKGDTYCYGHPTTIIKEQLSTGQLYLK